MADLGQHLRHPTRTLTMTAILLSVMIVLSALDFWKHRQMPPDALEQRLAKGAEWLRQQRISLVGALHRERERERISEKNRRRP